MLCALVFCLHICLREVVRSWSYRHLLAAMWVLGLNPDPVEEQSVLLPAEPALQPRGIMYSKSTAVI